MSPCGAAPTLLTAVGYSQESEQGKADDSEDEDEKDDDDAVPG